MKVLAGPPEFEQTVADYVLEQFPDLAELYPGARIKPFRAVAFVDAGGVMHGGLVMTDYRGFDAHLSIYLDGKRFIGKQSLTDLMRWTFDRLGLRRVTCFIRPDNTVSRRFVERIGFKREGVLRKGYDGTHDALIFGMTREDCGWLG